MKNVIITILLMLTALATCACGADLLVPSQYSNIQSAIDAAVNGDVVIVAPGTYTGDGNHDIDFLGKAITVRSTDPNDPNIVAATIIDCNGTGVESHRGFYFHSSEDANSILDGFTVIRCSACGDGKYEGGGIYCYNSSPTIRNCNISGNSAVCGGGISCYSSSPTITNCTITGNTAWRDRSGGGINCYYNSSTIITNCTITGNSADYGGGLFGCIGPITNCTITGNSAGGWGGGLMQCGPILNCTIIGNSAKYNGGGLAECGNVTNCTITGNSALWGGGLFRCMGPITNCTIAGNSAKYNGGGIYCYGNSSPIVTNCILWNNTAPHGPEIYVRNKSNTSVSYTDVEGGRAAVYIDPNGKLNWLQGNIDADPCFVEPGTGYWDDNNTPGKDYDDFWVWFDGDYHLKSEGWSWDIKRSRWTYDDVTSRCIDAGNPGSPLSDELLSIPDDPENIWGQNLRIDMGAFGRTAEASIPPYDWALLADLTNDGLVNLADFAFQAADWLNSADQQPGDLNRDSLVDIPDLALLIEDWLEQTIWH